jgi:outer membrane protein TolC
MEQGQLEADLYQLRERINQLFFGILLIDEQVKENDLVMADIRLGLNKVLASISNGTAFKSNADVLRAELLKDDQNNIELRAGRKAYADMLGFFTGKTVDEGTVLTKPGRLDGAPSGMSGQPVPPSPDIHRPELSVYALQDKSLDIQDKLLKANALPKLGLFLQGGWGRPGLDMLDNNFTGFYIGGIRLTWSPSAYYTLKKQHALIGIDRQNVAVQRETFLFNTHLTIKQQDGAIDQYRQLLASDDEIVALRDKIKNTSLAQLENGAIDSNDYLREVNAEDQARQGKIVHTIQLLMSQYNQRTTTGNQL